MLVMFALALLCACFPGSLEAQTDRVGQVLLFGDSTFSSYGRLIDLTPDTITLLTVGGRVAFPREGVRRIIVRPKSRSDEGVRYGIVLGAYAGLFLLGTQDNTGTFMHRRLAKEPGAALFGLLPGMAVGAGIGFLVDQPPRNRERIFELTGDGGAWERMSAYLAPPAPNRFHLSILASRLFDLSFDDPAFGGWGLESESSQFNFVRRLQGTYSVYPGLEAGLAFAPTGTLKLSRSRYENPTPTSSKSLTLNRSLKMTGYFAVVQYSVFHGMLRGLEIKGCAGIGWTSVSYSRVIEGGTYSFDSTRTVFTKIGPFYHTVSRADLSGMLSGELSLRIDDHMTFGVVVDRFFLPEVADPGEPAAGSRSSAAVLSSWGFGLQLGFHF